MVILTDASDSTRSAGLISNQNFGHDSEKETTGLATEDTEDTERKESRPKKFLRVRVVNRFFSVSSVSSVANDSVRSDFRAVAAWPKKRKNARPKTNTRRQHENLFSSNVDRSRRGAEFFTSGGALESHAHEESKTNPRSHFRGLQTFFRTLAL